MDRALAPSLQTQRQRRRWLLLAGAVALVLGAVLAFRTVLKPSLRRGDILTATVETGDVEAALTAAGTVRRRSASSRSHVGELPNLR